LGVAAAVAALLAGRLAARRRQGFSGSRRILAQRAEPSGGVGTATKAEETKVVEEEAVAFFEEVSGDDPIVQDLEERMRRLNGNPDLTLEMLLNPGSIVNAERAIILLRAELMATPEEDQEARKGIEDKIEEKQMKIVNEMRLVMTDSLKLEFLLQAVLSIPAFAAMCYGTFPWVPDLSIFGINKRGGRLVLTLLGIWGLWLVTVPALRARKPGGPYGMGYREKRALDTAFLILPVLNFVVPAFNNDPAVTFWVGLAVIVGCYAWSFVAEVEDESAAVKRRGIEGDNELPEAVTWALKALDFGTGSERGARSEDREWKDQLDAYQKQAEDMAAAKKAREAAGSQS